MIAAIKSIEAMGLASFIDTYKLSATRADGLVSLKYNQIESPMHEPCVADCRGLVVDESDPTRVVAMAYRKFWNLGEKHADNLDWSTARVAEKLDGSLMTLYRRDGRWCVASSGHPTAGGPYNGESGKTFRDVFWETWAELGYALPEHGDHHWYMFELCRPDNRIVVRYEKPRLVLHGARRCADFTERDPAWLAAEAHAHGWEVVKSWAPGEASPEWVTGAAATIDPLALEGYVVSDAEFRRVKVKSPRYVEIHHLRGNRSPRGVIDLWKLGEVSEVLAHFPEMAPDFEAVLGRLREEIVRAGHAWQRHASIDNRKDFAQQVKSLPLSAILFRFYGSPPVGDIEAAIEREVMGLTTPAILRVVGAA